MQCHAEITEGGGTAETVQLTNAGLSDTYKLLPNYKMRKSETLPLQAFHWYPSGTSSHPVSETLTIRALDKNKLSQNFSLN